MLANFVELGAIECRPEPLDASSSGVSRTSGRHDPVRTVAQTVFTHSMDPTKSGVAAVTGKSPTPAERPSTIRNSPGEILITFILYTDTLLSINQIALLSLAVLHDASRPHQGTRNRVLSRISDRLGAHLPDG